VLWRSKGDLYITFLLIIIPILKRQRQPLFNCNFRLVYCSAWRELTVNTFDGKVKLKVTEGTQNDTKIERKRIPVYKKEVSLVIFTSTIKFKFKTSRKEKKLFTTG
jgi:curved DNA-binding protein